MLNVCVPCFISPVPRRDPTQWRTPKHDRSRHRLYTGWVFFFSAQFCLSVNSTLLHFNCLSTCSCLQLQELMCHVMMGNLVMFRKDSVLNILSKSVFPNADAVSLVTWLMSKQVLSVYMLFDSACVCCVTVQSLDWETFEQYSTWQLFLAHSIPLETIIPILQHLKYKGKCCTVLQLLSFCLIIQD